MLFAETVVEVIGLLGQFGPAALAAVAVWWLTNKYEKLITEITNKHFQGMEMLSRSIKAVEDELAKRDVAYQNILERKITAIEQFSSNLLRLSETVKDSERRLEEIEKKIGLRKNKEI